MNKFDLIIIGAGPGGYRAAEYAARQGLQVLIVERDEVGGTCLNRGCIPTKTYVHSATFAEACERQQQVVMQLRSGVEQLMRAPGITLTKGSAMFVDAQTIQVGEETFTAPHIIIATGSEAKMLPLPDIDDPRVVCIIGAGVIGMEFASVFNRYGSEVTVIEYLKECLPMVDSDIAKRLRKLLEKRGITFRMKTAVSTLADIDADVILMATGRKPCTDGLHLEAAGITLNANGTIPVDNNYQVTPLTSHLSPLTSQIYAIGDVNGRQMLAHAAEFQAKRVVNHIVGKTDTIRFDIMPAAIFTEPEVACVGLSEDQCKAQGIDYQCRKSFWRANGKALAMNETEGMLKLLSSTDGHIMGCHAFGTHAADLVQEVSVLMCKDATVDELDDMIHIHPTLSELIIA